MREWANLCGSDGRVKARINRRTRKLVIKDRGNVSEWDIDLLVQLASSVDDLTVETVPVSC